MKAKLKLIFIFLTFYSFAQNCDECRKHTVDIGKFMDEESPKFEKNKYAIKAESYTKKLLEFYGRNLEEYTEVIEIYKKKGLHKEIEEILLTFNKEVGFIAQMVAKETGNKYKLQITLTPNDEGAMEINSYLSYGQLLKNNKNSNFKEVEEIYRNLKNGRPAIFNSSKSLEGNELPRAEMVEFASTEVMGIYINKVASKACEKYIDYISVSTLATKGSLAGSVKKYFSKSFVYLIRSDDRDYFAGEINAGYESRLVHYKNAEEALSIYKECTENKKSGDKFRGYKYDGDPSEFMFQTNE